MSFREEHRLRGMLEAIDAIESHVDRAALSDGMVFDAVCMRILEIGEAVKSLPAELLAQRPEVSWGDVAGMRDHLAHRYFDTEFAIVEGVVLYQLTLLRVAVEALLAGLPSDQEL